jgi:hypothetical protein
MLSEAEGDPFTHSNPSCQNHSVILSEAERFAKRMSQRSREPALSEAEGEPFTQLLPEAWQGISMRVDIFTGHILASR